MRQLKKSERKPSGLQRLKSALLCGSIAVTASGCTLFQDPKPVGTAAQLCRSWKEIGIRKADKLSTETGREIVANNEARPEWCGKIAKAAP